MGKYTNFAPQQFIIYTLKKNLVEQKTIQAKGNFYIFFIRLNKHMHWCSDVDAKL